MIALLSGGIGAARLAKALAAVVPPEQLTCIVNTADDLWRYGLRICPDVDTMLYALAGRQNQERGWGLAGDTMRCMEQIRSLGQDPWFSLGDLDLATHLLRSGWLREGVGPAEVTRRLAEALGVRVTVLPMTEAEVETQVLTPWGWFHYQEFLVWRDARDIVKHVRYKGIEAARPAPGVLEAIRQAELVIIGPSNPVASIRPILSLPGILPALLETPAPVLAVTPVVSGVPISNPGEAKRARSRAALMAALGLPHMATAIAGLYRDFMDVFVLDEADEQEAAQMDELLMNAESRKRVVLAPTLLSTPEVGVSLARRILSYARSFV